MTCLCDIVMCDMCVGVGGWMGGVVDVCCVSFRANKSGLVNASWRRRCGLVLMNDVALPFRECCS